MECENGAFGLCIDLMDHLMQLSKNYISCNPLISNITDIHSNTFDQQKKPTSSVYNTIFSPFRGNLEAYRLTYKYDQKHQKSNKIMRVIMHHQLIPHHLIKLHLIQMIHKHWILSRYCKDLFFIIYNYRSFLFKLKIKRYRKSICKLQRENIKLRKFKA
jgi:hypothetical protein